jgi:hypothetical protein
MKKINELISAIMLGNIHLIGSASFSVAGAATTATSARAEALDQHDRTWLA